MNLTNQIQRHKSGRFEPSKVRVHFQFFVDFAPPAMHCQAGMNVIRCNMSHGDHEEQSMKLANLEKARVPNDGTLKILKTQIFIICRIKMDYISIIKYHQVSSSIQILGCCNFGPFPQIHGWGLSELMY